jgi:hypothetical protein
MNIPVTAIARPVITQLIALQRFFFGRPMIDIDIVLDQERMYGQKSLGLSAQNPQDRAVSVPEALYDMEYTWHYKLRLKNNSTKPAYGIKVEKIYRKHNDYVQGFDAIASLEGGQLLESDYIIRHEATANGEQSKKILKPFPGFLGKIEVIVSYTNEGRTQYYTKFVATATSKTNEYLFRKPKELKQ